MILRSAQNAPSPVAYSEGTQQTAFGKKVTQMGHTLKIGVTKAPNGDQSLADRIVTCRKVDLRERLLRFLLGEKRRLTILVPGDSVKTLSIIEEGGNPDEQDE